MHIFKKCVLLVGLFYPFFGVAQLMENKEVFTKADTLRGTLNPSRNWWNVQRYDITVTPNFDKQTIEGHTAISFSGNSDGLMQIDLQQPLIIDSVFLNGQKVPFERKGNIALIEMKAALAIQALHLLDIFYHGKPRRALRPPWDGGWIWTRDEKGNPWMSVACQGLGASAWFPCKDHQSDEPDKGASLTIVAPDTLVAVGNGRLVGQQRMGKTIAWKWEVTNPINSYNIIPYIGKYVNFKEVHPGEKGPLDCTYWVLDYELPKAKKQFTQVTTMLKNFEYWFGPYPFYEDGYQLVQAPHLGMEHQSAIAYGNKFANGYLGRDLSGTGWGNKWDFIIVHESGHEWFGNNITSQDIADMWIHEGFTNYSETLFTEGVSGWQAAQEYVQGIRKNIRNDIPIIGPYGVNKEGSGDMYPKAANMIHTIRTIMQNDSLFRQMLRNMNATFYHQSVTTQQIEQFIQSYAAFNCQPIFDQYLRHTQVPKLEWKRKKGKLLVRFANCEPQFEMPVYLPANLQSGVWKTVGTQKWTTANCILSAEELKNAWNRNLFIEY